MAKAILNGVCARRAFGLSIFILCLMAVAPAWAEASSTAEEASFCFSVFQIPFAQCQALEALYNATGGPSWTQNSGWLADFEPCGWHGVSCAGSNVVSLSLADNNLVGTIPSEIGGLAGLTAFDLAENSLSGPLPATFGELDNLVALDFSNNQISDLGSGFSGLDALLSAKINDNVLTALPADFNSLTTLQLAFFSRNALDELPDLSGLNNLSTLWVPGNRLEALPAATCSLPALTVLEVGYNRIPLTPSHPCWPLLDAGDTQTQTVSPEIENAFAHPDRPFDDAVVEWTPIDFSQEGGGYRIFMSQTENGEYQLIGQVEDKSVSTFTAKNLSSGERYFFAVETYTDAHGSNPNALVSDRTNPYPLGNSGLPAAARASCLAHINQIGAATGKAQALETVHFHGVVGPLGHIADPSSYRWTYTAADAQCDPIMGSNPVDLPMSRSFATNAIPEGHWRIDFMASENPPPAACLPDFQCLTVLPDRSLTDLEILASEVEIVEPNPPFPPIVGQISPHKQVAIRFTVHNRSAISELTEVRVEAWAGDPDDGGTPIGVVDIPQIGPQGQNALEFTGGGGDDNRAVGHQRAAQLQGRRVDAAAAAMKQDGLAGMKAADHENVQVCRDVSLTDTGGGRDVHCFRDGDQVVGVYEGIFGISAAGHESHDPISRLPATYTEAERIDATGHLQAENVRLAGRRRVVALALNDVGPVD